MVSDAGAACLTASLGFFIRVAQAEVAPARPVGGGVGAGPPVLDALAGAEVVNDDTVPAPALGFDPAGTAAG